MYQYIALTGALGRTIDKNTKSTVREKNEGVTIGDRTEIPEARFDVHPKCNANHIDAARSVRRLANNTETAITTDRR